MRSYGAARGYFSFIEFLGWAVIICGVFVGLFAFAAVSQVSPFNGFMAALPGIALVMVGCFVLVFIQTARATVDSAEYAQQSLKLSRDHFELSKQMLVLAQTKPAASAYASDTQASDLKPVTFDTAETSTDSGITHVYHGAQITQSDGAFVTDDKAHPSLIEAKQTIDSARLRRAEKVEAS